MAALIRSEKLKDTLFDTAFYENGIGDNYDFVIGNKSMISVLTNNIIYHHEENINRVKNDNAYYFRISALHYIMKKHKQFNFTNLFFLIWSLIGNSIIFFFKAKFKMLFYNFELIFRIIFNKPLYKSKN